MEKDKKKKSKRKKLLIWLLVDLIVFGILICLFLHTPAGYNPLVESTDSDSEEVHPYIHRNLASTLYNGAQSQKPFQMEVAQLDPAVAQREMEGHLIGLVADDLGDGFEHGGASPG